MTYHGLPTFIETKLFSRMARAYLTDDDYRDLQGTLTANPEAGAVIPGTGGIRKLRWGATGRGKRGGVRVMYFLKQGESQVWMLTVYAKNETSRIPARVLRDIREEIDG